MENHFTQTLYQENTSQSEDLVKLITFNLVQPVELLPKRKPAIKWVTPRGPTDIA